jgi:hypothetical protein
MKNERVQLIPKTRKGKTVCLNRGFLWDLDRATMAGVTPSDGRLFIRSQDGKDFRWVDPKNDPNFEVSIPERVCGMDLN